MDEKFDQNEYIAGWKKKNMASVVGTYNKEFVKEFKEACKKLGLVQSQVIRKAMEEVIEKAKKQQKFEFAPHYHDFRAKMVDEEVDKK